MDEDIEGEDPPDYDPPHRPASDPIRVASGLILLMAFFGTVVTLAMYLGGPVR